MSGGFHRRGAKRRRPLTIQPLELRCLLAGDLCNHPEPAEVPTSVGQESDTFSAATFEAENVRAADAGSSRGTAADLGDIDGTRQVSGSLSWYDRSDVFRFSVAGDADVAVSLSGLSRNADVYLADESDTIIAASTLGGRNIESINASLAGGDYYVWVVARSYWWNQYDLSVSASVEAAPVEEEAPPDDPVSTGGGSIQPLAEVAYFGGNREWNLNAIGAPEAWAAGYTGEGVTVAVVDTGVDLDHPDLVQNLFVNPGEIPGNGVDDDGNGYVDDVHGYDFADRDGTPDDLSGHGTHVAGTIAAANNGFGATGVAPDATILPVRVLGRNGTGSTRDVAAGIRYAADLGADIINLSLGGGYSSAISSAIDYARSLGSFVVAAAGNESASMPGYPARFSASDSNVISVGAHNSSNNIAGFSNDVGRSGAIQVDAPGVGIFSTYVGARYGTLSGTSMAAPHVAGLAALTVSSNPDLTTSELRDLLATGTVGRANGSDALGLINATTTVAYAAAGLTTAPTGSAGGAAGGGAGGAVSSRVVRTTSNDVAIAEERSVADPDGDLSDTTATDQILTELVTPSRKAPVVASGDLRAPQAASIDDLLQQEESWRETAEPETTLDLLA